MLAAALLVTTERHPRRATRYGDGTVASLTAVGAGLVKHDNGATTVLIGRQRELATLGELTRHAAPGTAVIVRGGSGVGKSALLRRVLRRARADGHLVLCATADSLDTPADFGVVHQLLEHVADEQLDETVQAAIADFQAPYRAAAALAGAGRRVVLGIDDLQWADTASVTWLSRLLRRLDGLQITVVTTMGPEVPSGDEHSIGTLLPLFRQRIWLTPLGNSEVGELAEALLGAEPEPDFVTACRTATGGIPALLHALLRSIRTHGAAPDADTGADLARYVPAEVGRTLQARLRACGPDAVATAEVAAVLAGSPAPTAELIACAANVPQPVVEDSLHTLTATGLMVRAVGGTAFSCPVLSVAIANEVPPSRRQELHARAARYLIDQGAAWDSVVPHLLNAPLGQEWAIDALLRAADEAMAGGDRAAALGCLRRALREPLPDPVRAQALASLGEAELARCLPSAVHSLRRSLDLATAPGEQAAAARSLSAALFTLDRYPEGLDVLEHVSERIRAVGRVDALRLEIDLVYARLSRTSTAASAMPRLMAMDLAEAEGTPVQRPLAALLSLRSIMDGGNPADAVAYAEQAMSGGLCPADDESFVYTAPVLALAAAGRSDLALAHVDATMDAVRAGGSVLRSAYLSTLRAGVNYRVGNVAGCEADARAAVESLRGVGAGPTTCHSVAMWTDALVKQGRTEEAEQLLADHGLMSRLSPHWANDFTALVRGRLRMVQGRAPEGLADFLHAGARARTRRMAGPAVLPWRSEAALAHACLGEHEEARALVEEELTLAQAWGVPEVTGVALRARGLITGGSAGADMLRESVRLLKSSTARFSYAQALADYGALVRRNGLPSAARSVLQQAVSTAKQCGAIAVEGFAQEELRAAGYRAESRASHGLEALTRSERRVADLAAEGMTNKEIAAKLFVGLRTVEVHLSNAYHKLGISGRAGLAEALAS
ncbi:AAA family ATPase [Streptomyces sp. NPDC002659]|uniref:helix-turn-helix transcriptional regulator n=1 Tax=Streptomyces sp. NPDC002659 TaxID=3364656 RepID=UPI0036BBC86C